ncbi:MAG: hypothetical protein PF447_03745 [Spirochaetaceae bacterium]|jgi:hypothetical protein|nr:hypothetical protein [Spirochaetaceae bacterium]
MSLNPLDLQTLFSHSNEVGKHQSHVKAAANEQQRFEAQKLINQELQKDKSVNSLTEDQETGKVDDNQSNASSGDTAQEKKDQSKDDSTDSEKIKDPNLGQNIDLLG